jgi:putative oxidoreductase
MLALGKSTTPAHRKYVIRTMAFMVPYALVNIGAIFGAFDQIHGKPSAWILALVVSAPVVGQIWATLSLIRESDEFVRALTAKQFIIASGLAMAVASIWGFGESYAGAFHLPAWLIYPLFWFFWGVSAPFIRSSQ